MSTKKRPTLADEYDSAWREFWRLYPRRQAKVDARKAWAKLAPDEKIVNEIAGALEWQGPLMVAGGYSFIPLPATWLRGRRWEDERPVSTWLVSDAPRWQGWECPHVEPCNNRVTCDLRTSQGRPRKADPREGFTGLEAK